MTRIAGGVPPSTTASLQTLDTFRADAPSTATPATRRSTANGVVADGRSERTPSLRQTADPAVLPNGAAQTVTMQDLARSKYKLGSRFDAFVDRSPSLRAGLLQLQNRGFRIEIGSASYTNMKSKTVTLAEADFSRLDYLAQSLSHELGHATNDRRYADFTHRDKYIGSQLDGEGAAVLFNLKVRQELLNAGVGDIGVLGQPAFEKQAIADWNAAAAGRIGAGELRTRFSAGYASQRPQHAVDQNYVQFYGTEFDKLTRYSPELKGKVLDGAASDGI